jgi:hypothetical protein
VPTFHDLKLGTQLRWQNDIRTTDSSVVAYGVVTDPVVITQKILCRAGSDGQREGRPMSAPASICAMSAMSIIWAA